MKITIATCLRRNPRSSYYDKKFQDFSATEVIISEFSPLSSRNRGFNKKWHRWHRVLEAEAKYNTGVVFFKNASFYGGSRYYITKK